MTDEIVKLYQKGQSGEALARLGNVDQDILRPLRHQQMWRAQLGIMKLRQHIHKSVMSSFLQVLLASSQLDRDHLAAADYVLAQLQARPGLGREEDFEIALLEIDLKMRRRDFSSAMDILEKLAQRLSEEEADVYCRIKLMTLKACIYNDAGISQKGFSVALRAASLALQCKVLPSLWEAINAVCAICNSLSEFEASTRLLESIVPQVLECEDCELAAQTFSLLADSHVGLAGQAKAGTIHRKEQLTKALEILGRAFDEYSRNEDVRGQCQMMAKKATIMHLNGDPILANDCASKYLAIKEAAKEGR